MLSCSIQKKIEEKDLLSKVLMGEISDLSQIKDEDSIRLISGISEVDRVLGGGLVKGSISLLSGEPGVGKSTILAQIADSLLKNNSKLADVLYISGEESASQVKLRLERLKCDLKKFKFIGETNLEKIISSVIKAQPGLLIVDSIQTIYSASLLSEAGGVGQIRMVAIKFMELAKKYNIPVFLIGHVTKDGQVAGPKSLEHIVDVVLYLENDGRGGHYILRSVKNRFGSVNEIGVLEMTGQGLEEVKNPSLSFLESDLSSAFSGSVFSCVIEGRRPFLINVQALVSRTVFGYPQRKSSGFDSNRLQVLSALISKRQKLDLMSHDIILNIVGGFKTNDPALDLAVSLAIISSLKNKYLNKKTIVLGELGLGGELRAISHLDLRLKEAEKMGFTTIILPKMSSIKEEEKLSNTFKKIKFIFVKSLDEALKNLI